MTDMFASFFSVNGSELSLPCIVVVNKAHKQVSSLLCFFLWSLILDANCYSEVTGRTNWRNIYIDHCETKQKKNTKTIDDSSENNKDIFILNPLIFLF